MDWSNALNVVRVGALFVNDRATQQGCKLLKGCLRIVTILACRCMLLGLSVLSYWR